MNLDLLKDLPFSKDLTLPKDFKEFTSPKDTTLLENEHSPGRDHTARLKAETRDMARNSPLLGYLRFFFNLPYWERTWIFQDIVFSEKWILFYADNLMESQTLAKIYK